MIVEIGVGLAGLILGYAVSKLGVGGRMRGVRRRRRVSEEGMAYIKGVNYILSDAPDLAIEEFIKAVKINTDTVETYLALGSLYRSKGDVGRAIRIHQGIIFRPNVDQKIKNQALYELGLDYKTSGMMDRAIATFKEVIEKNNDMLNACLQLAELYEEMKDWESAFKMQEKIARLQKTNNPKILAHLMTEIAKRQVEQGDPKNAHKSFRKAISIDPQCVDAYLHHGDLYAHEGQDDKAVETWQKVMEVAPQMTFLAYDRLEHAFFRLGKVQALEELLRRRGEQDDSDIFTKIFLARHMRKKGELDQSARLLKGILHRWPNSREARQELIQVLLVEGKKDAALREYEGLLQSFIVVDRHFQCRVCGFRTTKLLWKCPQCLKWDTMGSREDETLDERKEAQEA